MISEEYKLAFVHIPKCGGTSVEKLFTKEFISNPHVPAFHYYTHNPDLYRFTMIRNTWDRLVSIYFYSIQKQFNMSFDDFIMRYIHHSGDMFSMGNDKYFFGKCGHLIFVVNHNNQKPLINFYANLWNAKEHLTTLFNHLKMPLSILDNWEKHNPTIHEDYRSYYKNKTMIDAVANKYSKEINFFKFKFDDPCHFDKNLVGKHLDIF